MTIIVLDGPEKAGKTTLVKEMGRVLHSRGFSVNVRRWGPVNPDDRVYAPALQQDIADPSTIHIWDRSWASEFVYSTLLERNRRLNGDPWLGEWLHGRAVSSVGIKVMVESNPVELVKRRDDTDLPVNAFTESNYFRNYQTRNGWYVVVNGYTQESLDKNVDKILSWVSPHHVVNQNPNNVYVPPKYAGPINSRVLIVGKARSEFESIRGAWLPFSSRLTTELGKQLGVNALHCGWTNLVDAEETMFWGRDMVVFCGKGVDWPYEWVPKNALRVNVDHPSYSYRFNHQQRVLVDGAETHDRLESIVDKVLSGIKEMA